MAYVRPRIETRADPRREAATEPAARLTKTIQRGLITALLVPVGVVAAGLVATWFYDQRVARDQHINAAKAWECQLQDIGVAEDFDILCIAPSGTRWLMHSRDLAHEVATTKASLTANQMLGWLWTDSKGKVGFSPTTKPPVDDPIAMSYRRVLLYRN